MNFHKPLTVALALLYTLPLLGGLAEASTTAPISVGPEANGRQVIGRPQTDPFAVLGSLKPHNMALPNLVGIVSNRQNALLLGKALFWDQQAGSDGIACGSCHFAAGADNRITHQVNPGTGDLRFTGGDRDFGGLTGTAGAASHTLSPTRTSGEFASGQQAGNNLTLGVNDFPLHRLKDPRDRNSEVLYTTNDVVGSSGSFGGTLVQATRGSSIDQCQPGKGDVFHGGSQPLRQVTGRNAPTVINAGFYRRLFWDGRANAVFNGEDPFGARNANAFVVEAVGVNSVAPRKLALANGQLASQAVGPALSEVEASCGGRNFAELGRRLASIRPLQLQAVHANDSVLGKARHISGKGLNTTYSTLIQTSFDTKWWRGSGKFRKVNGTLVADANGHTQQELNFALFWGVAIALYEATLKSDDSPFDQALEGRVALTEQEMRGALLFANKGKCTDCHTGPMFSTATPLIIPEPAEPGVVPVPDALNVARIDAPFATAMPVMYDEGWYNLGVTPTATDPGIGGNDPWGKPLSYARQVAEPALKVDNFPFNACWFERPITEDPPEACNHAREMAAFRPAEQRLGVDGAFKTPSLRNVGLTAPYFHNGGYATLRSVVEFYARGGNRRGDGTEHPEWEYNDNSGTGSLGRGHPVMDAGKGSNVLGIEPLIKMQVDEPEYFPEETRSLTDAEIDDLVAFMLTLTDRRVQCQAAPFDHPAISLPDGHLLTAGSTANARDFYTVIPATGAAGLPVSQCLVNSGDLFIR
ncbi:MAG: cytochrome-c peroxidase [Gammaproteobacteria bacterium]